MVPYFYHVFTTSKRPRPAFGAGIVLGAELFDIVWLELHSFPFSAHICKPSLCPYADLYNGHLADFV
jgi:hypothetical protein